ncbi:MAG: hypothetical protein H7X80_09130, partial [bacterium]|nr:hypothetical protein [Candidatus Kapabacteria bacterium]
MILSLARALPILFLATMIADCASSAGGSAARSGSVTTEHYYGTVISSSADGKIPMGPPVMTLLRRDVDPSSARIVVTLTSDGKTQVTTLKRENGTTFRASANDNSISGTLEYAGREWDWQSWKYAIAMSDGSGSIEGTGRLDGKWMETERYFVAKNGER